MKFLKFLIIFILSFSALANELKVEVNPNRPVAGEMFQVYFRIFTDSDEEPVINFSPSNVEVAGKSNQGVSTRTIYANGKLTVTREMTVVYELVAAKAGTAYLRDITVQLGSDKIRHQSISINILNEPEVRADAFVMADLPKKSFFLGEGFVVRYFLYSKVAISNLDVKEYPKLNKFLKRYLQEPDRSERVSIDGEIYTRTLIYAAKLFPEKLGTLKVDPLRLSVTYPVGRAGDPFGAFGLNRDFKTRSISSDTIDVEVKPFPAPQPPHFTGLVGNHDIQLQVSSNKLIVNEPLELKLTVSGVGALENLEAPTLIKSPGLEEFDTNGDLKVNNSEEATKVFDYTYLAKENQTLPAKEIILSYLDPATEQYVPVKLNIPEITIAGGQATTSKNIEPPKEKKKINQPAPVSAEPDFFAPIAESKWQWQAWIPHINLGLAVMAILISFGWMLKNKNFSGFHFNTKIPASLKKNEFDLGEFVLWLTPLIRKTGKSPLAIIKESTMSEDSKRYFIDLLETNDYKSYSSQKAEMTYKFDAAHFKELSKYIESAHENTSKPS